ncbi:DoxX family protein [Mucilaginibacter sp. BT774]|uniref:DoxX family protein n=1 Tax=Mucilaginibacter sp. BT774 TaxID=3062276 RepID=UPI0026758595|nr:DoxX family protein [Mucilaginibacter sp. BT774]MDO3627809.1 DoxX family protein [Mucilaginibacter sp. BT774]
MPDLGKIIRVNINDWKERNGIKILRFSLGFIFFWFGVLKFFHGISPAESIAGRTISQLTFGVIKPSISLPLLALWECTIGLGLITGAWMRLTLILLYLQMAGTFLPLIFFPHETFSGSMFIPTLLGQYIIKNFVLISGGIVLGANLQGDSKVESKTTIEAGTNLSVSDAPVVEQDYLTFKN